MKQDLENAMENAPFPSEETFIEVQAPKASENGGPVLPVPRRNPQPIEAPVTKLRPRNTPKFCLKKQV